MNKLLLSGTILIVFCLETAGQDYSVPVEKFDFHSDMVNAIAISPDGKLIASASKDKTVAVASVATGEVSFTIKEHKGEVKFVEFSKDSKNTLSASEKILLITDNEAKTSQAITFFENISLLRAGFNKDEVWVVARNLIMQNLNPNKTEPKKLWRLNFVSNKTFSVDIAPLDFRFSGDGNSVYAVLGSKIEEIEINSGKTISSFEGGAGSILGIDMDRQNEYLLAAFSNPSSIRAYHLATKKFIPYFSIFEAPVKIVSMPSYFVGADDNQVVFKNYLSLQDERITAGVSKVTDFAFTPDGKYLFISTESSSIKKWLNPFFRESEVAGGLIVSKPPPDKNQPVSKPEPQVQQPAKETKTESPPPKRESRDQNIVSQNKEIPDKQNHSEIKPITDLREITDEYLEKKYKESIDTELSLRPDLFLPKGEFEKTVDYEARLEEQKKFRESIVSFYRLKEVEEFNFKQRLDSISIARREQILLAKIASSLKEIVLEQGSLGNYNADKETFPLAVAGKTYNATVPIKKAPQVKENFDRTVLIALQQLKDDGISLDTFNLRLVYLVTKDTFAVGPQRRPVLSGDKKNDPVIQTVAVPSRDINTQPEPSKPEPAPVIKEPVQESMDDFFLRELRKLKYYALIIGIQDYDEDDLDLTNPIDDASALAKVLTEKYMFDKNNTVILENPSRSQLIYAFDELADRVTDQDEFLIFYAGHGYWDENQEQGYWLPRDASLKSKAQWLSNGTLRDYIRGINSKHTLLIADACFSGGIFRTRSVKFQAKAELELYKLPSRKAMTSGNLATVPDKSVFMQYLIKRLQENDKDILSSANLFSQFREAVILNSPNGQVPQFGEIRESGDEGGDFIFVTRER